MTSIKEALERIKRTALDAKPEDVPKALAHIVRLCIDADRTTVESGDARERIARIIASFDWPIASKDERERWIEENWQRHIPLADAILASGLVPNDAAIRADERERCAKIADCMADEYDATSFTSTNADQVAALRSKEQAAHEIAAAIRAGRKS